MATNADQLPVPPLNVGDAGPGVSRVAASFEGKRSIPISSDLRNVLEFAASAANVEVVIYSGGQKTAAEATRVGTSASGAPIYSDRTGSSRHDNGNAADLRLYQGGKLLNFQNADDRNVISAFISASIAAGATGVGAGIGYMGPAAVHVGFGPNGVKGGPVMTWGAGGHAANAPSWLVDSASPTAVRQTIATLQTSLKALGYLDGPVDGLYGDKTIAAVNAYALATGARTVSMNTMPAGYQAFLGPGVKQPLPVVAPDRPAAAPVSVASLAAAVASGGRLRKGSTGEPVKELQTFLNAQGVRDAKGRALKVDGVFGPRTRQALTAYQETHPELRRDAVVGPRTAAAIIADQAAAARDRARIAEAARYTGQADAIALEKSRADLERAKLDLGNTVAGLRYTMEAAATPPQDTVAALSASRGASTALALIGTGMTLQQFNERFGGGLSQQEFAARFDPTAPAFSGSTGVNQTWNGLPPPGFNLPAWVWGGLTKNDWTLPDASGAPQPAPESLWVDNAFLPHDPVTEQLGNNGRLGAISAPEFDAVSSAKQGGAALLRAASVLPAAMGIGLGIATPSFGAGAAEAASGLVYPRAFAAEVDNTDVQSIVNRPSGGGSSQNNNSTYAGFSGGAVVNNTGAARNVSTPVTTSRTPTVTSSGSSSSPTRSGGTITSGGYVSPSTSINYSTGTTSSGYGGIGHM